MTEQEEVILSVEPSSSLSEICGFPYLIEKRVSIKELLENGVIDKNDLEEMRNGKQICKALKLETTNE